MSVPAPWTDQQIADQLTRDGVHWNTTTITYSFNDLSTTGNALDATQMSWIDSAIGIVEEIFALDFVAIAGSGDITFNGSSGDGTYTGYSYYPSDHGVAFADIFFDQSWTSNQSGSIGYGSYGFTTIIHEFLHALGLDHPGNYNGTADYLVDAEFQQDTHRYTVMSYFNSPEDNSGSVQFYESGGGYYFAYPQTPMVYDILALSAGAYGGYFGGYGFNTTTRATDTTYGYNATAGINDVCNFDVNGAPVMTIYDAGGIDTLDLSGDHEPVTFTVSYNGDGSVAGYSMATRTATVIDLNEGHYSSTHGMVNNIAIAFGTKIENAVGTEFDDTIYGNDLANVLRGGDGNDVIDGGLGNDRIFGGLGSDSVVVGGSHDQWQAVRFGDVVQLFSAGSAEKDWVEGVENFDFTDVDIALAGLADNDPYSYLASYRDLLNAFGTNTDAAVRHYFNWGHSEGRSLDRFDEWSYLASYSDLLRAFGSNGDAAARHYVQYGYREGRVTDKFDEWSYLASYSDLLRAFGSNGDAAARHYVQYGYREGRVTDKFDEYTYIASYGDLIRAFGTNGDAGTRHYVNYGYREGRVADFDARQYLDNYADLRAQFGDDLQAATLHYIQTGYYDGLTDDPLA